MRVLSAPSLASARSLSGSGMMPFRFGKVQTVQIDGEFGTLSEPSGAPVSRFAGRVGPDHDRQRSGSMGPDQVTTWVLIVPSKVVLVVGDVIHDYARSIDYKVTEARSLDSESAIANTYLVCEVPA